MGSTERRTHARGRIAGPLALVALLWPCSEGARAGEAAGGTAPAAEAGGAKDQQVLARVNGEPVMRAEWLRLVTSPFERRLLLDELGVADPDPEELGRFALQKLIHRRLLLQEAGRRGLTVTPQELDQTIAALRRRFDDLDGFGVWMKERGLDGTSLFRHVRADILVAKARGALAGEVSVADEQVRRYHQAHAEELRSEEVWLQFIAVADRAEGEEIQAALRRGEDFGRLAQARSIGRRAAQGGDAGWVTAETLSPPLRDAVASLKPGEAVGPLPSGEDFLIVRLHQRRPGRPKTLAEAWPEIERRLLQVEQHAALREWLREQEKTAKVEVFVDRS